MLEVHLSVDDGLFEVPDAADAPLGDGEFFDGVFLDGIGGLKEVEVAIGEGVELLPGFHGEDDRVRCEAVNEGVLGAAALPSAVIGPRLRAPLAREPTMRRADDFLIQCQAFGCMSRKVQGKILVTGFWDKTGLILAADKHR